MVSITCRNIRKSYGEHEVIHGIDLTVPDKEFVVLLGPSGCGKSTMLRMIAGLETITDGELRIGETLVNDLEPGERDVAMVFQSYALYPHMSVYDNIAFGLRRRRVSRDEVDRRVREVAETLQIVPFLERRPKNLSGGQQQRVAMARAMIKTPKVFLFDEPLSNLDAKLREQLRFEIKRLHLELDATTVLVTHDQMEALTLADRIVLMRDGRIEQNASPAEIFAHPATRFVADFIGTPAMNFLEVRACRNGAELALEGRGFTLTVPSASYVAVDPEREITAGVRPVTIDRVYDEGPNTLTGRVILIENMGLESLVFVDVGGSEISFTTQDYLDLTPGCDVSFRLDGSTIHLFGPDGATLRKRPG